MQTKDTLQKMISENNEAVIYALDATQLVEDSMERTGSYPPATKHLGQGMMAAVLLQALNEKDKENVSLQWMCDGPFGHLYTDVRNFGEVRGTIREGKAPVLDYETTLGKGLLQVRRSVGSISTTGIVDATGDVSADIVEYLERSEQKSCGVNFSVQIQWDDNAKIKTKVQRAIAYLIHVLPQASQEKMNEALLRWDRQMRSLGNMSRWILRENQVTEDILRLISCEENPNIVLTQRVKFSCNCSEKRALRALEVLVKQEKKEGKPVDNSELDIRCEYCGRFYKIRPGQ